MFGLGTTKSRSLDPTLQRMIDQAIDVCASTGIYGSELEKSDELRRFSALPPNDKTTLIGFCVEQIFVLAEREEDWQSREALERRVHGAIAQRLLRARLPFTNEQLTALLRDINKNWSFAFWHTPWKSLVKAAEHLSEETELSDTLKSRLKKLAKLCHDSSEAQIRRFGFRIDALVSKKQTPLFNDGPNWVAHLATMNNSLDDASAWLSVLRHSSTATTARPTKKWLKKAEELLDELGKPQFLELFRQTVTPILEEPAHELPLYDDINSTLIRGLVWCCVTLKSPDVIPSLQDLGAYAFRKVRDYGPGSPKVGNAVIFSLGSLPDITAISSLTGLRARVKYLQAQSLIEKALTKAAHDRGIEIATLEEMAVPTHGFDNEGRCEEIVGNFVAITAIDSGCKATLTWKNSAGKIQKTVPKDVSENHAMQLKELRKQTKEVGKTLQAQKFRVEQLLMDSPVWQTKSWREYYVDHPLMQHLVRPLIWEMKTKNERLTLCHNGSEFVMAQGQRVSIPDSAEFRLWHPINATLEEVRAWRKFLVDGDVTQPFKQAHREIYLLTDAERQTEFYSNRFAGHILRQHQLLALCRERGWHYTLQGNFDSHNNPTIYLPKYSLSIEYVCIALGQDNNLSDSNIFLHVSTDQVQFFKDRTPVRLADIDMKIFSEVMRDVDLFVGVTTIGNDPNWSDGGYADYDVYWQNYAFGDLNESAKIRRDVIASLIPKLKIKDQLELVGNHLVVRGHLRTYRIHIGSSNIQMDPNNEYLCIVESSKRTKNILLPFEGDSMLSMILSKAALLANDKAIKDRTIRSQITRGG